MEKMHINQTYHVANLTNLWLAKKQTHTHLRLTCKIEFWVHHGTAPLILKIGIWATYKLLDTGRKKTGSPLKSITPPPARKASALWQTKKQKGGISIWWCTPKNGFYGQVIFFSIHQGAATVIVTSGMPQSTEGSATSTKQEANQSSPHNTATKRSVPSGFNIHPVELRNTVALWRKGPRRVNAPGKISRHLAERSANIPNRK